MHCLCTSLVMTKLLRKKFSTQDADKCWAMNAAESRSVQVHLFRRCSACCCRYRGLCVCKCGRQKCPSLGLRLWHCRSGSDILFGKSNVTAFALRGREWERWSASGPPSSPSAPTYRVERPKRRHRPLQGL